MSKSIAKYLCEAGKLSKTYVRNVKIQPVQCVTGVKAGFSLLTGSGVGVSWPIKSQINCACMLFPITMKPYNVMFNLSNLIPKVEKYFKSTKLGLISYLTLICYL